MSVRRYYTIGAVVPDLRTLGALGERLEGVASGSLLVLARRRDERLIRVTLPDACVRRAGSGLSKRQWLEFASTFFSASTVSFLMGVVHPWTGIVVQAIFTVAAAVGLLIYHRRTQLREELIGMGLPERLSREWEAVFSSGLALALATVPEELLDEAREAFLEGEALEVPLAVDRRPVL
jgi:hypothetical protein